MIVEIIAVFILLILLIGLSFRFGYDLGWKECTQFRDMYEGKGDIYNEDPDSN
jgi:hypothetical protein